MALSEFITKHLLLPLLPVVAESCCGEMGMQSPGLGRGAQPALEPVSVIINC